jgi:hypothetical protein
VLNAIGDDLKYTCNVALIFYNNLAQDIHNQIKSSGYLPPETFSDNSSQALYALRGLSLKEELEVASIISISKRANGAPTHACFPKQPDQATFPSGISLRTCHGGIAGYVCSEPVVSTTAEFSSTKFSCTASLHMSQSRGSGLCPVL